MILLCLAATSCDRGGADVPNRLTVFAASSVADVVVEIAERYETKTRIPVGISRGSSGKLCKQLQLGAECDVYIPADTAYLDRLRESKSILDSSRSVLAGNELVVIMSGADRKPWIDGEPLKEGSLGSIAVANPDHAPAGRYAMQALMRADLMLTIRPRILFADNVRMTARYVASGGVNVGIVYVTDAVAFQEDVSIVYRFPQADHAEIAYEGAVCSSTTNKDQALSFLEFANSTEVDDLWRRHGFVRQERTAGATRG